MNRNTELSRKNDLIERFKLQGKTVIATAGRIIPTGIDEQGI
jgi:hypothetical protein